MIRDPPQVESIRMVRLDENVVEQIDTLGKRVARKVPHHSRCSIDVFLKTKFKVRVPSFFEHYH